MTSNTHTHPIDFMIWIAPSEKHTDNAARDLLLPCPLSGRAVLAPEAQTEHNA